MKKIFKILIFSLLGIIGILFVIGLIFTNVSPQFGQKINEKFITKYAQSTNWQSEKFQNTEPVSLNIDLKDIPSLIKEIFSYSQKKQPRKNVEVINSDLSTKLDEPRITWFGHSSFLLEIAGKSILIDPMFSQVAAPHPWLGKNRYNKNTPIKIKDLPKIDIVIISHDHYDHLDFESIKELKEKTNKFFVPLGIARHLEFWGIGKEKITEHDWWESSIFDELILTFAPAKHFSGRGFTDRNTTLWGSWIIKTDTHNLFFSGDSGYGKHFKEIGKKFGPFDFAMVESGQYDKKWPDVHMFPEESVQAAVDLQAKNIMPIHWGAFTLAYHSWTEPVERFLSAAQKENIPVATPIIGESILLGKNLPQSKWWENYK